MKDQEDVEELKEVLDVISEKIPGLLRGLRDVLYSRDSAESMADAVGTFYKKLVEAGIPKEDALEMARGYMINLRDVMKMKDFDFGRGKPGKDEKEED